MLAPEPMRELELVPTLELERMLAPEQMLELELTLAAEPILEPE